MRSFWLCFVPLFVAVDAVGVLPIFLTLTEELNPLKVKRVIYQSMATAAAVALSFLAVGTGVLKLLGITVADFMVAGGVLLFVISMSDLITTDKARRQVDPDSLGAVPLGVPLIAGPAVFTTSILLVNEHGVVPAALALLTNIAIAGAVFLAAGSINRLLGKAGAKTVSKIAALLLAAIAVMIVRKGITALLQGV
ncbi:MAG: MarC family protein [Deltaproteobacteria bacterium CG_4_8_14_3_um_filter_51_11]|nr:MarC family protein [bacterium]OIP42927.1 MAG: hypothetical protein AUK25_02725 [Desulfobacteraceae bacterium CG2_30_51_40]PIP44991.1 MAG: multiple antibiotic resistance (MarC)-like protein [Deltaproteobacteria bacterium CG23_combo_of_CG06-09_8_20_14_all_51_20]PIX18598.1 MAG: MarC family protein [Deltaproteobacteria bacterium CG_4_8_14_3_um_filter_51_11]PIY27282.1 MAG: MarC family protein [Deltaproteobacteria bacterium CG_4_10_14_3_um_filter_51_14]